MKTSRRPASPRLDRKADILLAAEKLFAQSGYHAVSIRDIAQEAGVPLALVGYHYGPKHELFHAIFAHWNSTIEERLRELKNAHTLPRIVDAFVGPVLRMRGTTAWVEALEALKIGCGPINTLAQVFDDPQVRARDVVVTMPHAACPDGVRVIANPVRLSETPADYRLSPPLLGADTEGVLGALGGLDLVDLRARGIV